MKDKTILSLQIDDIKAEVIFDGIDATMEDLLSAFKGLLIAHTFTVNQINQIKIEDYETED